MPEGNIDSKFGGPSGVSDKVVRVDMATGPLAMIADAVTVSASAAAARSLPKLR